MRFWHDCQHPEHHRPDAQGDVQKPHQPHPEMALRDRHVRDDGVHPVRVLHVLDTAR